MSLEKSFLISAIVALCIAGFEYLNLKDRIDESRELWVVIAKNSGFSFVAVFMTSYFVLNGALDSVLPKMSGGMSLPVKTPKYSGSGSGGGSSNMPVKTDFGNI